jgi:hypothetical protein
MFSRTGELDFHDLGSQVGEDHAAGRSMTVWENSTTRIPLKGSNVFTIGTFQKLPRSDNQIAFPPADQVVANKIVQIAVRSTVSRRAPAPESLSVGGSKHTPVSYQSGSAAMARRSISTDSG